MQVARFETSIDRAAPVDQQILASKPMLKFFDSFLFRRHDFRVVAIAQDINCESISFIRGSQILNKSRQDV